MDDVNRKELEKTLKALSKERTKYSIGSPERDKLEMYYEKLYQLKIKEDQLKIKEDQLELDISNKELQRAEQADKDAAELELEDKKIKNEKIAWIIDKAEKVFQGLISGGAFLLLLDYESDHSLRSKAWPIVEKAVFRKK